MTLVRVDGPGRIAADDGRAFAVLRLADGSLRVTDVACPHNGGPLDEGTVRDDDVVVCPWHWYRFALDDGRCLSASCGPLRLYPVVLVDGVAHADVGDPPRALSWSERLRAHAREDGLGR